MISSFDSILLVIYLIVILAGAMTVIYLLFKVLSFLLDKLMELLLSKTTLDVEVCAMIVAVISTIAFVIALLLIWVYANNISV
ncbi:hypothetical protein WGPJNHAJ_CDS0087 [Staphylococcus phage PG-2021_19]